MDNLISGLIAVAIFLAFVLGLAHSIGQLPFVLIVVIVSAMLCFDFYQSARDGLAEEKEKKRKSAQ
jgi:4-hydroxybenzoate polyprenyltransferase